jgi:acetyl-CoA synthetase
VIWCFAVLRPGVEGSKALRQDLCGEVVAVLGKAFAPARVEFVAELPKTRSGKVLRRAIRARVLGLDAGDLSTLENAGALELFRPASGSEA